VDEVFALTKIDRWFLRQIEEIVESEASRYRSSVAATIAERLSDGESSPAASKATCWR